MTRFAPLALTLLAACTTQENFFLGPFELAQTGINTSAYSQQRGAVELIVKSEFPAILTDISAGSGPVLTRAMDAAGIPAQDRSTRALQLRGDFGLYSTNPGALVTALMVYGG